MGNLENNNLVVCSVTIAPARLLFFYKIRTWLDQIVKVIVHTFAVDRSKIPLEPSSPIGYWYCAGDFCNIDEAGVYQHLCDADIGLSACLVAPDIKDDDPKRNELVIGGEYGVHYVCHNITNRVLYATDKCNTLIDLDISTIGYELVVKSTLGVYGQNKIEWDNRKKSCKSFDFKRSAAKKGTKYRPMQDRTRHEEIAKIHLRACNGDMEKSRNLTDALSEIDEIFRRHTEMLVDAYDEGGMDSEYFNREMVNACSILFTSTIRVAGLKMTKKIYPNCNLDIGGEGQFFNTTPIVQTG